MNDGCLITCRNKKGPAAYGGSAAKRFGKRLNVAGGKSGIGGSVVGNGNGNLINHNGDSEKIDG